MNKQRNIDGKEVQKLPPKPPAFPIERSPGISPSLQFTNVMLKVYGEHWWTAFGLKISGWLNDWADRFYYAWRDKQNTLSPEEKEYFEAYKYWVEYKRPQLAAMSPRAYEITKQALMFFEKANFGTNLNIGVDTMLKAIQHPQDWQPEEGQEPPERKAYPTEVSKSLKEEV